MKHDTIEARHERLRQSLEKIVATGDDASGLEPDGFRLIESAMTALREDDISSQCLLAQFYEGVEAGVSGATQIHNPYDVGASERDSWHKGWKSVKWPNPSHR